MFGKKSKQELRFEDQILSSLKNRTPAARLVLFLLVDIMGLMLGRLYLRYNLVVGTWEKHNGSLRITTSMILSCSFSVTPQNTL